METFNELCLLVMTYHLICFSKFVTDEAGKQVMGMFLIGFTAAVVAIEIFVSEK